MRKIKRTEIPTVTASLLKKQEYRCPLCNGSLHATATKQPALDHCHDSGYIRAVLCFNCNGVEGTIKNYARRARGEKSTRDWLAGLVAYWDLHSTSQVGGLIHPTHKNAEEKRILKNTKARNTRAKLKAALVKPDSAS